MKEKYSADKKHEIVDKKINKQDKFKLVTFNWVDNILTKTEEFFDTFDFAKKVSNKKNGTIKIYDKDDRLLHSEKKEEHKGKGHYEHSNGKGLGHEKHDDDLYA